MTLRGAVRSAAEARWPGLVTFDAAHLRLCRALRGRPTWQDWVGLTILSQTGPACDCTGLTKACSTSTGRLL